MIIRELRSKEAMLAQFVVVRELYPTLSKDTYAQLLDEMLPNNRYFQLAVFEGEECLGLAGIWIGTKLWCGKYLEIDNLVVAEQHRSVGVGDFLFEHIRTLALDENCSMMALDSYTTNFSAHKFFYRKGFGPKGFHFIHVLNEDLLH